MYARWGAFAIGMGLILAPLLLGYREIGPIFNDVAIGLVVCILTLAALEAPSLRFLNALPAIWLVWTGRLASDPSVAIAELVGGALLVMAALVPRARVASRAGMRA